MADFINTVDIIGDDTLTDSIINKSIIEYNDNEISSIWERAFFYCANLKSVKVPSATYFGMQACSNCNNLTTVDLTNIVAFASRAFYGCRTLRTFAIRGTSVCTLENDTFDSSSIKNGGSGYIYVPKDLIESYKTATYWSTYATQFRALEDYTVDGTINGELDESKI